MDGKAALAINRSNATGSASIQVEIAAAGTTAVVGTHYNINDPSSPFTGSPPTTTVSFVNGQPTAYVFIPTINNPAADGNHVVALNLKNPSGLSLGSPASTTLTILDVAGGSGEKGIDGLPMATVTINQLVVGSNNFCAFGRFPGGNLGPCGASPVSVSTCGTGIGAGGVTNAWQLNMVDGTGALTYTPFRNHTVHLTMSKGHAMSWKFHTPPANQITSIVTGGFSQTTTTIGAEATTFMSVSTSRCDFDYTKVNTIGAGACYRSIGGTGNNVDTRLSPTGTPPDAFVCEMTPDTDYYLNIRWENVAGAQHVESCPAPTGPYTQCGMVLGF